MNRKQRTMPARIIATIAVTAALQFIPVSGWPRLALYLAVYLTIGYDILAKAGKGIANGRVFDENFLMAVATVGAFALALYEKSGDYLEAIAVMLFYQIGEFFQRYAVGKSRRDIAALMDIRPDYANVEKDGKTVRINPEEVPAGDIIIVQPGEKVPIDGVVMEGSSSLDTAALTGEPLPRLVGAGHEVLSGSINLDGLLKVRTTKEFSESTVSKILELVEESASRKSKSENFIARFARVYTPAVCYSALALALLPPLFLALFQGAAFRFITFEPWIYRALTFLVISCPCALVVSIPLSFFAGIGGASRRGILVKGANVLESLSKVKTVVFDKTGTLTKGVFEIKAVHDAQDRELSEYSRLVETAALAESASSHPIGKSLLRAYGKETDRNRISGIRETGGHGVMADLDNKTVAVGNEELMADLNLTPCPCREAGTLVHVAEDGVYQGHILMGDTLKPGAQAAIRELHRAGVRRTVMLTGDTPAVAQQVAQSLGIDRFYGGLLPAGKVARMEELLQEAGAHEKTAFVGDGINDAPVLSRADIGIAMGALGSDAAIEAADVVLMDDDPRKIGQAIRISRKCLRIVRENIVLALGIKGICLGLGVFGIVNMWLAIFADVGVMVLAVLNAIRAMYGVKE
ncbi:MAG: cadmium-translocating P-type ATPase [Bacteroides sp.]|nr:cadmium-translocating P-type ATPase [Bacteroides sp.]MCM1530890.1 cadmium-translocating P-type ATPase [Ruminococcus flavefaciens]MCM1553960.1 cadmium-translocating P-type ATPase [Bacteroides sp.]